MKIWLDTEFNGFGGNLISLGCVAEDGSEFYEVVDCPAPTQWVRENVFPVIGKLPIAERDLRFKLASFLNKFDAIEIIADWAEDIEHFCRALLVADGQQSKIPPISMSIVENKNLNSAIPHNALEDARALMLSYIKNKKTKKKSESAAAKSFENVDGSENGIN